MRKIGEHGRVMTIMAYENDVSILDEYMKEHGYISSDIFEKAQKENVYRSVVVKARKEALHAILSRMSDASEAR